MENDGWYLHIFEMKKGRQLLIIIRLFPGCTKKIIIIETDSEGAGSIITDPVNIGCSNSANFKTICPDKESDTQNPAV